MMTPIQNAQFPPTVAKCPVAAPPSWGCGHLAWGRARPEGYLRMPQAPPLWPIAWANTLTISSGVLAMWLLPPVA